MSDAAGLGAFVRELAAAGVTDAIVCPGSRSTPLALALRTSGSIHVRMLYDERAAGFFALGLARTSRRPVVLLATSGTAVVEFAPAVVEASLSRVPLVVLTSDRPAELRDRGAPQAIDQAHLYGRAAKWFTELPPLDGEPTTLAHWRFVAGRAVAVASEGPAGPVQVNVPFREPLLPDAAFDDGDATFDDGDAAGEPDHRAVTAPPSFAPEAGTSLPPFAPVVRGRRILDDPALDALAIRLATARRGVIVAGPDDDPALPVALASLARATRFPILADPLSGLRTGPHDRSMVVARADQLCRPGPWIHAHEPDLVLRTGAMPTAKPIVQLLERTRPDVIVLDGDAGWREAALVPATFVHADPAATASAIARRLAGDVAPGPAAGSAMGTATGPARVPAAGSAATAQRDAGWARAWLAADRAATEAMDAWLGALDEPFEGAPWPLLAGALPHGALLWAASSMPVRDADAWLPSVDRAITVRSNRGANGIDGVVSTALGSAAADAGPVALVTGDIAFLHDLNALVAARLHGLSATIVLVNNDGGGIFSFLPQAQPAAAVPGTGLPEHYEELFGTPHGIDVGPIVEALGGEHRRVTHRDLCEAIADSISRPGVRVLELRTERARNLELHRAVAAAVQRAIDPLAAGA